MHPRRSDVGVSSGLAPESFLPFPDMCDRWFQRRGNWTLLLILIGTFGMVGWIWRECVHGSEIKFLTGHIGGKWILYPSPPSLMEHPRIELWTTFRRAFRLPKEAARANLKVAALERSLVSVNGTELRAIEPPKNWKKPQTFESKPFAGGPKSDCGDGVQLKWTASALAGARCSGLQIGGVMKAGKPRALEPRGDWRVWRRRRQRIGPGNPAYGGEEPWHSLKKSWLTILLFGCLSGACVCWDDTCCEAA